MFSIAFKLTEGRERNNLGPHPHVNRAWTGTGLGFGGKGRAGFDRGEGQEAGSWDARTNFLYCILAVVEGCRSTLPMSSQQQPRGSGAGRDNDDNCNNNNNGSNSRRNSNSNDARRVSSPLRIGRAASSERLAGSQMRRIASSTSATTLSTSLNVKNPARSYFHHLSHTLHGTAHQALFFHIPFPSFPLLVNFSPDARLCRGTYSHFSRLTFPMVA